MIDDPRILPRKPRPPSSRSVFFATCAPGLEPLLHEEIRGLRLSRVERQVGGVRFEGDRRDAWRANLELRTAVRVLERLARFPGENADAIHAGAKAVAWERYLRPGGKLAVSAQARESSLEHSLYLEQLVKDAVVDRFRARGDDRPSVDLRDPDLAIHLHLFRDRATLSLDTSGEPLHKRGWRLHQGRAPLAETLAAALVMHSGWDRRAPLLDPCCGSGTIPIESAWIAAGIRPGSLRRFGFERWRDHDARLFDSWRSSLPPREAPRKRPLVQGSDIDPARCEEATANAQQAGVGDWTCFERADARQLPLRPGWNAWIVANLPYGQRLGAATPDTDLFDLYRDIGARLRADAGGSTVCLLSGSAELSRSLGLDGARYIPLQNGGLPCEMVLARL